MEALVDPEAVDVWKDDLRFLPAATQLRNALMADLVSGQCFGQRIKVELGIGPRSRGAANIDDQRDLAMPQQLDELNDAPCRMANRVNGRTFYGHHASASRTTPRNVRSTFASNHGFFAAQWRERHDGCGRGNVVGKYC